MYLFEAMKRCGSSCQHAVGVLCTCPCRGANHGVAIGGMAQLGLPLETTPEALGTDEGRLPVLPPLVARLGGSWASLESFGAWWEKERR